MVLNALRQAFTTVREHGVRKAVQQAVANGFLTQLADGNLLQIRLRHGEGKQVGEDGFGNKYYEKTGSQYGRHRWVVYNAAKGYDASSVPPEWHGWLHNIIDELPTKEFKAKNEPKTFSATPEQANTIDIKPTYVPKGHALNPAHRDWRRIQTWKPEAE
eukprot:jgi/Chlat1/1222/Chrsp115S01682